MDTQTSRPAYRKPWTHGARAYDEADTFAALKEGMKRCRKTRIVHMPNDGEAGLKPCAVCGIALRDMYAVNSGEKPSRTDEWSTWEYNPRTKKAVGMHYYCSWGALMNAVLKMGRAIQI